MSNTQNIACFDALDGLVNGRTAGVYKAVLVMTNSTIGGAGEEDAVVVDDYTTLDEMDGANYVRKDLAGITVTQDDTNNRGVLTFTPVTWTALGAGTRSMKGVLILEDPADSDVDTQTIPRWFLTGGFPVAANGTDFVWGTDVEIRLP